MYLFLLPLVVISLAAAPARAKKTETGFLDRTVTVAGRQYKYRVFVPDNWTKKKKWPVILFLHGAGERADDGLVQTQVGIGAAIRRYRDRFPSVVVMPQCRKDVFWAGAMADVAMPPSKGRQRGFHAMPTERIRRALPRAVTGLCFLPE